MIFCFFKRSFSLVDLETDDETNRSDDEEDTEAETVKKNSFAPVVTEIKTGDKEAGENAEGFESEGDNEDARE
ncbi:hypothetical protein U1Q18_025720 [Sarracenia purpurea var. burkii]